MRNSSGSDSFRGETGKFHRRGAETQSFKKAKTENAEGAEVTGVAPGFRKTVGKVLDVVEAIRFLRTRARYSATSGDFRGDLCRSAGLDRAGLPSGLSITRD